MGNTKKGNKFRVILNTQGNNFTVSVIIDNSTVIPVPGPFTLVDDDDFNHDDFDYQNNEANPDGDNGEDVRAPNISLIRDIFAYAYVSPEFDIGGNGDVPFVLNSPDADNLPETYDFDNDDTEDDKNFWTVYLLGAYQPHTYIDGDPPPKSGDEAIVSSGAADKIGDGKGVSIFKESGSGERSYQLSSGIIEFEEAHVVVHEIGHLFGGVHEDGGIMEKEKSILNKKFEDVTLERIRDIQHP